jgi:predicted CXXCH cytochrome family protein
VSAAARRVCRSLLRALLLASALTTSASPQDLGKIVRPVDKAAFAPGPVTLIATAPAGRLELDGKPLEAEQPFPDVLVAKISPKPGEHALSLLWENQHKQVRFFVGDVSPAGFTAFRDHPPAAVECTHCHGLSRRGRFRFQGGCFDCHQQDDFPKLHQHQPHTLEQCGMCHNAHGSTVKAHLTLPREQACKQCHN